MKKQKNDETPLSKTSGLSCLSSIFLVGFFLFLCGLYIFAPIIKIHLFAWRNIPIVEAVVREECNFPDYETVAYIDHSGIDFSYSDFENNVRCELDSYPDGDWICTCEEQENN